MNTQVVLDELDKSLMCRIFGHTVMRNLKVKITIGVMWHLVIPQSV